MIRKQVFSIEIIFTIITIIQDNNDYNPFSCFSRYSIKHKNLSKYRLTTVPAGVLEGIRNLFHIHLFKK